MPGPKPLPLALSGHERRVLRGWLRKQTVPQALVLRSRIVLACAEGLPNARVADALGISRLKAKSPLAPNRPCSPEAAAK